MTDRRPDIITQWKIKDNQDGTYTARCPAMPNVELTADNIVVILGKIEGCLKSMYPDNSQVDGGITGINAEYSVTKRKEQSLDCFTIPTDDPTPEPTTDAPELHEDIVDTDGEYEWRPIKALEAGCAQCERIQTGDCIGNYAGTSCGKYHARGDAGQECRTCKHRMLIWNEEESTYNKPFCTMHKADISDSDYCCYAHEVK